MSVRADRFTAPIYANLPESTRRVIEERIPANGYLSLTHGGRDFRAHVFVGTVCVAQSLPCRHVEVAAWQALRKAEAAA